MQVIEELAAHFEVQLAADILASLRNKLGLQLHVFLRVKTNRGTIRCFLGQMLSFHKTLLFHGLSEDHSLHAANTPQQGIGVFDTGQEW